MSGHTCEVCELATELAEERMNYQGAMADLDDLVDMAYRAVDDGSVVGLRAYLHANYPKRRNRT